MIYTSVADSGTQPAKQKLILSSVTLGLEHAGRQLVCNTSNAITITIPASTFPKFTEIEVYNAGGGDITFAAGSLGVTILTENENTAPVLSGKGKSACLKLMSLLGNNTWAIQGAIE